MEIINYPDLKKAARMNMVMAGDGHANIFNINSLAGYRVKDQNGNINTAFDLILGKWLPMPMFEKEMDGMTAGDPFTWCRVRIDCLGEGSKKGNMRYRFLWAFDTTLGDPDPLAERSNTIYFSDDMDESLVHYKQPFFYDDEDDQKEFCLCNRADELLDFMSVSDYFSSFSDYFSSLLGQFNRTESRKYIGYYTEDNMPAFGSPYYGDVSYGDNSNADCRLRLPDCGDNQQYLFRL